MWVGASSRWYKPYFDSTIPAGTLKNLQGAVKGAVVPTVTVDALMVGNKGWVAKNPHEVKQIAALKLN
jgi:ABC-type proline/glycine betaine transport system substrate-binding protein